MLTRGQCQGPLTENLQTAAAPLLPPHLDRGPGSGVTGYVSRKRNGLRYAATQTGFMRQGVPQDPPEKKPGDGGAESSGRRNAGPCFAWCRKRTARGCGEPWLEVSAACWRFVSCLAQELARGGAAWGQRGCGLRLAGGAGRPGGSAF